MIDFLTNTNKRRKKEKGREMGAEKKREREERKGTFQKAKTGILKMAP